MPAYGFSPSGKPLFTPEEDQKLVYLKEQKKFSWREIAKYFRGRTQGTLQVRYSRKHYKRHQYHSLEEGFIEDIEKQVERRIQGTTKRIAAPVEEHSEEETESPVVEQRPELGTEHIEKQQGPRIEHTPKQKMTLRPVRSTPRQQAMPLQGVTNQEVPEHVGAKTRTLANSLRPTASKPGKLLPSPKNVKFTEDLNMAARRSPQVLKSRSAKARPGWNAVAALERSGADFKYPEAVPAVFVNPPSTHIIEFNTLSGSYRIRRRREDDACEESKAVSFAEGDGCAVADEGTNYQPAKRRKTATSQALSAAHMIQNSAPCPPVTQKSVVQPMQRPGRSSLAFEQPIQDSDDDEDESLTSLEDNPKDEANTSTNASEEGSGSFEGFEVVRRASEETESSTVSCFEDEQHIFGIV